MKLSKVVGRYFDAWICRDTWDSFHPLDNQRFYRFVKAVARYSRRPPLPRDIKTLIVERRGGDRRITAALSKTADKFVDLYQTLLEYEKTRGFPDALIERTNIVRYYLRLTSGSGSNHHHINRMMTDVWGKDWRAELHNTRSAVR
jgi:hypothetical protein